MDERFDAVRSVTDGRYVYVRNYYPHVSQAQHVDYQFMTPTTRVWRDWFDRGLTNDAQSIFWRVPRVPEELYDLQTDPDEVSNLVSSLAHQVILQRLRQAQRDHAAAIRDICLLPEIEMHLRSQGTTPYELARDDAKYPFARMLAVAELASNLDEQALPELQPMLADPDSAIRYWAALGHLMRGRTAVAGQEANCGRCWWTRRHRYVSWRPRLWCSGGPQRTWFPPWRYSVNLHHRRPMVCWSPCPRSMPSTHLVHEPPLCATWCGR